MTKTTSNSATLQTIPSIKPLAHQSAAGKSSRPIKASHARVNYTLAAPAEHQGQRSGNQHVSTQRSRADRVPPAIAEAVFLRPSPEDTMATYIARRRRHMTILVCQHKQTFCIVRGLMHNEGQRTFFGQRIDGVVYVQQEAFAHPGVLSAFEAHSCTRRGLGRLLGKSKVSYLYWGDVDNDSVQQIMNLYRANPGRNIRPFIPAYRCMLDRARNRKLKPAIASATGTFRIRLAKRLDDCQRATYERVMSQNLTIPQQLVDKQVLRANK